MPKDASDIPFIELLGETLCVLFACGAGVGSGGFAVCAPGVAFAWVFFAGLGDPGGFVGGGVGLARLRAE